MSKMFQARNSTFLLVLFTVFLLHYIVHPFQSFPRISTTNITPNRRKGRKKEEKLFLHKKWQEKMCDLKREHPKIGSYLENEWRRRVSEGATTNKTGDKKVLQHTKRLSLILMIYVHTSVLGPSFSPRLYLPELHSELSLSSFHLFRFFFYIFHNPLLAFHLLAFWDNKLSRDFHSKFIDSNWISSNFHNFLARRQEKMNEATRHSTTKITVCCSTHHVCGKAFKLAKETFYLKYALEMGGRGVK